MRYPVLTIITVFLLSMPITSEANTKMKVDCEKCQITFTITMWTDISNAHIKQIKKAVKKYWAPKTPLKYHNCDVKVVLNLVTAKQRSKKGSDSYFEVRGKDPKGGGATNQKGVSGGKGYTPTAKSHVIITALPNGKLAIKNVAHELGHVMGLDDPKPTEQWDKKGIKNNHIKTIIDKATFTTPSGTYGWGKDAECCKNCTKPKKVGFFFKDKTKLSIAVLFAILLIYAVFRIRKSRHDNTEFPINNSGETDEPEETQ